MPNSTNILDKTIIFVNMIFVAGCHRSGTTLASSLLKEVFGNKIPNLGTQMKASLDNPTGFNETIELARVNDLIIEGFGYAWDKPWLQKPSFSSKSITESISTFRSLLPHTRNGVWIDKDPRLCLTLDFYSRFFLKDIPTLAIIRNPFAVSRSLALRNGFSVDKGLAIWTAYNFLLFSSCNAPSACIFYEDINSNPALVANELKVFLDCVFEKNRDYTYYVDNALNREDFIKDICIQSYSNQLNRSNVEEDMAGYSSLSQACSKAWENLRCSSSRSAETHWPTEVLESLYHCVLEVLSRYGQIFDDVGGNHPSFSLDVPSAKSIDSAQRISQNIYLRENQQLQMEIDDLFSELIRMQSELADVQKKALKYKKSALLSQEQSSELARSHSTVTGLLSRLAGCQ